MTCCKIRNRRLAAFVTLCLLVLCPTCFAQIDEARQAIANGEFVRAVNILSEALANRQDWLEERPGQREVPRGELVATIRGILDQIEAQRR